MVARAPRFPLALFTLLGLLAWGCAPIGAQTSPTPQGHWEGAILVPGSELGIDVDLAPAEEGAWKGDISIPAQMTVDFPLSDVKVEGRAVSFRMADVPGDPTFKGTLSEDGKTITGQFTQGGATLEFRLARVE